MYNEPNLLLLKENKLKTENKRYEKWIHYSIRF